VGNVPNLRFPEFTEEWKETSLSSYAKKITKKNKGNIISNVLCNSANLGIIPQSDYFDRDIANNENTDAYYVIENGDFVYNPRKSVTAPYGPVNMYLGNKTGIISPLYLCFSVKDIYCDFLLHWFKGNAWHRYVYSHGDTGVRFDRVSIKDDIFLNMPIKVPVYEEQIRISKLLRAIDERIATQNKIIEDLKKLKSAIIDNCYSSKMNMVLLSELLKQCSWRNRNGLDLQVLSVSNKYGFIAQSDQFEDREVASDDTSNYKVVEKGMFAYNPARINVGSIALYEKDGKGIVSPMYVCFTTERPLLPGYLKHYFASQAFRHEMYKRLEGSVRLCLTFEGLCNIEIPLPSIERQESISKYLSTIENKVSLEECVLSQYQLQRRHLLSQMFI